MSRRDLLSTNPTCAAHQCPSCGVVEHVTTERVIVGPTAVILCHCRACGHSWHPQTEVGA